MEDKWSKWKSFTDWSEQNSDRLIKDYNKEKEIGKVDNISYEDYIGGRWQTNNL